MFEVETVMSDSFWEREQYAKAFLDKTTQIILLALLTTTVTKYLNARREQELLVLLRLFMYSPYHFQGLYTYSVNLQLNDFETSLIRTHRCCFTL